MAKNSARDDFNPATIRTLQERAGNRCSNLDCEKVTSGPHTDPQKVVRIGKASHICAAAPGGKRYDRNMTAEERSHISNGIWLCSNCATLIDTDEHQFPVNRLQNWKFAAEQKVKVDLKAMPADCPETYTCGHCYQAVPTEALVCPTCTAEVVWGSTREERNRDFQLFAMFSIVTCLLFGIWIPQAINALLHTHIGMITDVLSLYLVAAAALIFATGAIVFVQWRSNKLREKGPRFFRIRHS